ncbi:MAG: hypothetical protein AAGF88_03400 [Pseudomonadota bacterium]
MFRLIRLIMLMGIAFVAGMLSERAHQQSLCERSGGVWFGAGFCREG